MAHPADGLQQIASSYLDAVATVTDPPNPRLSGKGLRPPMQFEDNHPAPRLVGNAIQAAHVSTGGMAMEPESISERIGRAFKNQA